MEQRLSVPADTPLGMGNCGIVAVAMLAGVSHTEALRHVDAARRARPIVPARLKDFGSGWNGWTTHEDRAEALATLGVPIKSILTRRMQLRTLARKVPAGVTVMVRIARHVVTLRDGVIYDQGHRTGRLVEQYRRARSIVTHAHVREA